MRTGKGLEVPIRLILTDVVAIDADGGRESGKKNKSCGEDVAG